VSELDGERKIARVAFERGAARVFRLLMEAERGVMAGKRRPRAKVVGAFYGSVAPDGVGAAVVVIARVGDDAGGGGREGAEGEGEAGAGNSIQPNDEQRDERCDGKIHAVLGDGLGVDGHKARGGREHREK
jgi:hypothetical protein